VQSDAELVNAVLGGARSAFAALVRGYERTVSTAATELLHDRDGAQDAAQEAFVAAYEKLATLRNGSAFGAWVVRMLPRVSMMTVSEFRGLGLNAADRDRIKDAP